MKPYDAIIIGAGHNGLTAAAYLAKAGLDVIVLEKNDYIGGAAVTREMHKGWFYSSCSYVCSIFRNCCGWPSSFGIWASASSMSTFVSLR